MSAKTLTGYAYLVNLFKIRPAGVVSKKIIGDLKMARAIRSCSLRDACGHTKEPYISLRPEVPTVVCRILIMDRCTNLN